MCLLKKKLIKQQKTIQTPDEIIMPGENERWDYVIVELDVCICIRMIGD